MYTGRSTANQVLRPVVADPEPLHGRRPPGAGGPDDELDGTFQAAAQDDRIGVRSARQAGAGGCGVGGLVRAGSHRVDRVGRRAERGMAAPSAFGRGHRRDGDGRSSGAALPQRGEHQDRDDRTAATATTRRSTTPAAGRRGSSECHGPDSRADAPLAIGQVRVRVMPVDLLHARARRWTAGRRGCRRRCGPPRRTGPSRTRRTARRGARPSCLATTSARPTSVWISMKASTTRCLLRFRCIDSAAPQGPNVPQAGRCSGVTRGP